MLGTAPDEMFRRVAQIALQAYGFSKETTSIQPLTWVTNVVFLVEERTKIQSPSKYVLRIHPPGNIESAIISSEIHWLQSIRRDTLLRVPAVIENLRGEWLTSIHLSEQEAPFHCTLFEWLEGRFLRTSEQSPHHVYALGQFIGALHQHSTDYKPPSDFTRRRVDLESAFNFEEFEKVVHLLPVTAVFTAAELDVLQLARDKLQVLCRQLPYSPQHYGLIHADLIWKNYFFYETEAGALDFDDCGWGYYLYDLAPPLSGYRDEQSYPALRYALLAGYQSFRSLTPGFDEGLDSLIAARHIISCCRLIKYIDRPALRQRIPEILAYRIGEICVLLDMPNKPHSRNINT